MNQKLMIARFFLVLAIGFYIMGMFLPWIFQEWKFEQGGETVTHIFGEGDLWETTAPLPWLGWVKGLVVSCLVFALFAMLASFWSVSHPYMMSLLAFCGAVFGIAAFSLYISKSGKENTHKYTDIRQGPDVNVEVYSDPFLTGFVMNVCGTVSLLIAAMVAYPRHLEPQMETPMRQY